MKHYPKLGLENAPKTIILANGAFPQKPSVLAFIDAWIREDDGIQLICCDGAVNKLKSYTSKLPDALVGDLDSASPELKDLLKDRIHHVPDQSTNDLTKAVRYVREVLGKKSVLLLGASGGRDDHFLANVALLPTYAELLDDLVMLTDEGAFYLITEATSFAVDIGQQVSVFNFTTSPLSLKGVHWELDEDVLPELWAGSLNRADEKLISCSSSKPFLLYLADECKAL